MRPPTGEAIAEARRILIRSIVNQNEGGLSRLTNLWKGGNTFDTKLQDSNVEEHIRALSLALNGFQESINADLIQLRRRRNDSLRIHKIPYEIYLTIVNFSVDSQPLPNRYRILTRLSQVSYRWHDIITTTPPLWTVIQLCDPRPIRELSLQRSQQHGLTIRCEKGGPIFLMDETAVLQFFQQIQHSLDRWRRVVMHSGSYLRAPLMRQILQSPAPRLEVFSLEHGALLRPRRTYNLFGGHAPSLKELHLDRVPIGWAPEPSPIWINLLVIDVSFFNVFQPPMARLRQTLTSCILLQKLQLAYLDSETAVASDNHERVYFPHLQQIELLKSSTPALLSIVSLLHAPACNTLHLTPPRERDEEWFNGELAAALAPLATSMVTLMLEGRKSRVWLNNIILFDHRGRAFDVGFFDSSARWSAKPLEWILTNFRQGLLTRPVYLRLGEGVDLGEEELATAIWNLDSISSINVLAGVVESDALITRLSTPLDGDRWPLPDLCQIIVDVPIDSNQVVHMAINRYEALGSTDDEQEGIPVRFELLQFAHLQLEAYEHLKNIVGDDCEVVRKNIEGGGGSIEEAQGEANNEQNTSG